MRRLGFPPKLIDFAKEAFFINDWFAIITERMNVYSGPSDPTTGEIPQNQWVVYKNTTSGEVRIWVNDGGSLKKTAALT